MGDSPLYVVILLPLINKEAAFGDPHWSTGLSSQGPNEEQEEEHDQGSQDRKGCVHPLSQWDRSNGRSSRPVGMGLMEHVIKQDSLNVADSGG